VQNIDLSKITGAKLRIWADKQGDSEIDEVFYSWNYSNSLGYLVGYSQGPLSEFDVNPSLITLGQNNVMIATWTYQYGIRVYDSRLILEGGGGGKEATKEEEEPWIRNHEFQCWQVWVNDKDQFEFVFVWEYANNNHVQILDSQGNIVFYIDLPKGGCHFVADLPDGTYTVQNYHEYGHILREFVIGK
jgi:hypothetical protein